MRFKLLDKDATTHVHEGVAPLLKAPDAISWGRRVFIRYGEQSKADGSEAVTSYREVEAFRIGL